jgi:glutathione S-transferase
VTVAESGAIVEYLLERHGDGRLIPPAGTPERRCFTYWLHYAEGSAMPPLLLKLIFDRIETGPMPFFIRPVARGIARKVKSVFIEPQLATHFGYMESCLAKSTWFAGEDFTAADIQMSFPIEGGVSRARLTETAQPHLHAFLKRIHARPAYQRALDRGGPYDIVR